jgi:uncharacterized protein YggE
VPEPGTISVVGQGRAAGVPDVCRVGFVATALRPTVAAALADSEHAARRVRDVLAAAGVAPQDAGTSSLSVRAEEDYSGQRGPRLLGYRAEHGLEVVLRDLAAAGRVLGDAVAAGGEAVRLQGVWFAVEDDAGLRARAREAAWADALHAGEQLARLAGGALGAVRSIAEALGRDGGDPRPLAARAAAAVEIGLQPGAVDVRSALAVVWELT